MPSSEAIDWAKAANSVPETWIASLFRFTPFRRSLNSKIADFMSGVLSFFNRNEVSWMVRVPSLITFILRSGE